MSFKLAIEIPRAVEIQTFCSFKVISLIELDGKPVDLFNILIGCKSLSQIKTPSNVANQIWSLNFFIFLLRLILNYQPVELIFLHEHL